MMLSSTSMGMDKLTCPRCQQQKPVSEWVRNRARATGLSGYCRSCQREADDRSRRELRRAVVDALGGACCRCGFGDERALQVDHVNGGGIEDRGRNTTAFYRKVLSNTEGKYQLLCANCNVIKRHEAGEFRPVSTYRRVPPTEYSPTQGKGPWSEDRKARQREDLARFAAEHPEEWAERARRISVGNLGKAKPRKNSLTPDQVGEVLRLRSDGWTQSAIAERFSVSQALVSKLVNA